MCLENLIAGLVREGTPPRHDRVDRTAQTVNIGCRSDVLAVDGLFGGHVVESSKAIVAKDHGEREFIVDSGLAGEGESEIDQLRFAILSDEDVVGFDVAVDQAERMQMARPAAAWQAMSQTESYLRRP